MTAQAVHDAWDHLLQGEPAALGADAAQLTRAAAAILEATLALTDVAYGQHSDATDALQHAADDVRGALTRAERRYSGTGAALHTFAVELEPIHRSARGHIQDLIDAQSRSDHADVALVDANDRLRTTSYGGGSDADIERLQREARLANAHVQNAYGDVSSALAALRADERAREDAADRAIRAIEDVISDGADSILDRIAQVWDGAVTIFSAVAQWAKTVIAEVVRQLASALMSLAAIIVFAAALIIAVLLLVQIVGALALLLGPLGPLFLTLVFATAAVALAAIPALIVAFVVQELTGKPRRHDESEDPDLGRHVTPDGDAAHDYGDLIRQVADKDASGLAADAMDVKVVAITDDAGTIIAWRVQCPSTQYWSPFNKAGMNDLATDAMLSFFPGMRTQYEKAVFDAMQRAGVDKSDAPIMFTGWSLGGMEAAKLATTPQYADRVGAVVTAGSAIDKYRDRIGPAVNVTQINNLVDPVHHLEFVGLGPADGALPPKWSTYWIEDGRVHNGEMYAQGADRVVPKPRPGDEKYFADAQSGTHEVTYTERYSRR
ncbi:hypothetical protein [Microbacterium candidum]|uniref:Uncharacterized protein n=1 Tax=Microbacterium candidum TaxID=3041922 RepID=A0ABT7MUU4_9MICO|nr:hypothetical protein [Microbacterium sp. ASV49]MDL9978214.1 hypothetical protein [Microbacterium sp. ASV49]